MEDAKDLANLSHKIVDIAAGEAHTILLTGDGSVYSWGRGMFGRLGLGSQKDELFPVQVKFQNPNQTGNTLKIVGIAAGAYHSLALAEDGSVWCWGYNICVSEVEGRASLKLSTVKAGGMMSLAIDNHGTLWMWGNIPQESKESSGLSLVSNFTPTPVWDFHGRTVVKVACGYEHVVALVSAAEHVVALVSAAESDKDKDLACYSWGNNSHGQLGLGDRESRLHPEVVKTFDEDYPLTVYEVACGAYHTALLSHKKKPSDTLVSTCLTFGRGENGQLGHGTTQNTLFPTPVKELPQNVYLISVDCGLFHTSVVSSTGDVWSWGMEKGLGLCPDASRTETDSGDALSPLLISGKPYQPKFPDPVKVACGAAHTVVVAQEGHKMWSWGRGKSGVIGNGSETDSYTPTVVLWPPTTEDLKEEELKSSGEQNKAGEKKTKIITETDEELSAALNELKLLQTKLSVMERYAGILHGSIFGKPFVEQDIPISFRNSGSLDIATEWENMLEAADTRKLSRLEMFYRDMLAGVKDKLMERKIKEILKECLNSSEVKI